MPLRILFWLVAVALAVLVVAQNAQVVELRFLFWRVAMSQAVLLLFVLVAGIGVGWTLHVLAGWRRQQRPRGTADPGGGVERYGEKDGRS